ncbi:hypothetical protein DPMN_072851 [Dreissena polymorpha]|uniref:Uncharacterized protein n=1 Tax=Dreissena polymorpha TaxID=45954 RepID=A0A9D4HA19_DREPO|nr:hypothetical protein DPMN_072851 [Dreissena polymorpha]
MNQQRFIDCKKKTISWVHLLTEGRVNRTERCEDLWTYEWITLHTEGFANIRGAMLDGHGKWVNLQTDCCVKLQSEGCVTIPTGK